MCVWVGPKILSRVTVGNQKKTKKGTTCVIFSRSADLSGWDIFFFKNGGVAFFFIIRLGYDFDRENVVLDKTFPNDFCFTSKDPFPDWPGLSFFSSTRPITNLAASCNLLPTRALDHDRKGYKFQQDIEDTFMTC